MKQCELPFAYISAIVIAIVLIFIFSLPIAGKEDFKNIQLNGSLNPNNASAASIARLPGIGIAKAQAIVNYRQEFIAKGSKGQAFNDSNDLIKVKGLGIATVKKLEQWIEF